MSSSLPARQVRVPVGAGGIPQVHVGVDDAGRASGHRVSSCRGARRPPADPVTPTMLRSVSSSQSGMSGPPKVMLPLGRGWLRRPNQPAPATSSAPDSAAASGLHTRWADELADRLAVGRGRRLDADREGGDAVVGGALRRPGELGRGLGPAAAAGGGGVGERHQPDRALGPRGVVGHGPGPRRRRRGCCSTMPACSASTRSHPVVEPAGRRAAGEGDDDRVERTDRARPRRQRVGGAGEAGARPADRRSRCSVTPRASRAAVTAAASSGRSVTTAHERTDRGRPVAVGRLVEDRSEPGVAARRCSPGCASAGASAPAVDGLEHAAPATSRRRCARPRAAGAASITATSDPPAKITWPLHHEKSSPTRWAPNGPSSSGVGIEPEREPAGGRRARRRPAARRSGPGRARR